MIVKVKVIVKHDAFKTIKGMRDWIAHELSLTDPELATLEVTEVKEQDASFIAYPYIC